MGLLSKLKSLLGADDDDSRGRDGVDVTVERGADSGSERTDDGVAASDTTEPADDVGAGQDEAMESEPAEEEAAADADAAASTESLVDETHTDDPSRAAEPGEAADATGDDSVAASEGDIEDEESDAGDVDSDAEQSEFDAEGAEPDIEEAQSDAEDGESASVVKGIGPAYADRLADAGVETVADLAAADPAALAEQIDLSEKRVARWVERANDRQ